MRSERVSPESSTAELKHHQTRSSPRFLLPPRRGSHKPAWGRATSGSAASGCGFRTLSALKGRNRAGRPAVPPFQGLPNERTRLPGRGLGLVCRCPCGAEEAEHSSPVMRGVTRDLALVMRDFSGDGVGPSRYLISLPTWVALHSTKLRAFQRKRRQSETVRRLNDQPRGRRLPHRPGPHRLV